MKKKLFVFIFFSLIIASFTILYFQFTSNRDIFTPSTIRNNSTKVINRDSVEKIDNLQAKILIPKGFSSTFKDIGNNTVLGYISNADIDIVVRYVNVNKTVLEQDTGGTKSNTEIIEKEDFDNNYINVTDQIFRSNKLENYYPVTYIYFPNMDFLNENDVTHVIGQSNLPILKRGVGVNDGVKIEVFTTNINISEQKRAEYLQIADKVLLSIQSNE